MKTDQEIEHMLIKGRDLSLRSDEKLSIKAMLLDHAAQSLKHERRPVISPWTWIMRGSVALASLLMVVAGTGYASQSSLPGEPLYAIKVHMVEEMFQLTKITPSDRIAYDISLMETRLSEIQTLLDESEEHESEDFAVLTGQIEEHVAHIADTLKDTEFAAMPYEERIEMLAKLSGVSQAQVKAMQSDHELTEISDDLEETHDTASDALESAVEDFVGKEASEVVNDYLSDQITDVESHVHASTTNESTRDSVLRHIHDADEALIDGDSSEAVMSILEAQEVFTVDTYLKDSGMDADENSGL